MKFFFHLIFIKRMKRTSQDVSFIAHTTQYKQLHNIPHLNPRGPLPKQRHLPP